ncbi:MAG: fasciclin domain-containing protein [Bacteroidales bacterium]
MKTEIIKNFGRTRIFQIALVSALVVFLASCSKDDVNPFDEDAVIEGNIVDVLASYGEIEDFGELGEEKGKYSSVKPTFGTLNAALARTGLAGIVSRNQMTVFAPTDAAFAELGLSPRNITSVPNLREILLYHVLNGMVYSNQLSEAFFGTVNGSYIEISFADGLKVNDSEILSADIKARNGVIHVIDKVLFPPTQNLVELALSFDPEFSILVQAVIKAGLTDILATGGPFTVFAPTNDAFVALLDDLGATSLDDISVDLLTSVLLYHVVGGYVFSSDLSSGTVTTLNGNFEISVETLSITDSNGRESNLVPSLLDVQASNGVVHVIDRVILPVLSK